MSQDNVKKFEELKARAQKVNESAIKLNTQIENSESSLEKAREILQRKYQITDLAELKALAAKWEDEDIQTVKKLETDVTTKEQEVTEKQNLIKQIQNY